MQRAERIRSLPFFQDKEGLARQIIRLEQEENMYLPNEFAIKQVPPYDFDGKEAVIGRIHDFYYIGIQNGSGSWKYQAFASEIKCKEFFINLPDITDRQLAFWLHNIEMLS
ncbi:DUF3964 family protein [Ectobacillus ponti]|uniref:DUF3964 family protein n=1 Tax=Ectobacillus ponti TaxID=2961894 RepID=A0AA41X4Z2_9BACI|nr:DUF3964 family protein [Ectobacillus ponti]MCP8968852.1 DUF3964 family protein [Ectobacillus ponti]